jgi:cation:H+ antiporter
MAAFLFIFGAVLSLGASAVLVTRLERLGARFGAPEAMLGIVTALAADSPEIATAVTALARGQREVSVGVLLGSNVFNLAALLGLSALVAGRIALHRRVIAFEGVVALWVASMTVVWVAGWLSPAAGLGLILVLFVPYLFLSALPSERRRSLPLPRRWREWLAGAVREEEVELSSAIHPRSGTWKDGGAAVATLATVVGASAAMERGASTLGVRFGLSSIVLGGVVLAVATSLPNAVAAVYLASHGKGSATLAEAMNSNTLNVLVGLFIPAVILGAGKPSSVDLTVALWYGGLTLVALALAFKGGRLDRRAGGVIVGLYVAFVVLLTFWSR